jgi:hypothetical protein
MATSVLGKLGDKAKKFATDVNSLLPEDIEKTALDEKQKNVSDYKDEYEGEKHSGGGLPEIKESVSQDKINRHYGDRPGEKLIDTKPMLKPLGQGQPSTPLYDEGGDVDAGGKDKHQLAVLQDGEKVLTPDEAAQYKAEQALKANPTEEVDNRPLKPLGGDSAGMKDARKQAENPGAPAALPVPPPEQLPTATHEERVALKKDQQDAMGKGVNGLVQLGMANIHARQLGLPKAPFNGGEDKGGPELQMPTGNAAEGPGLQVPKEFQGAPDAAPAGLPTIGGTDAPAPAAPAPDLKAQLEKLKQEHAAALAERTPEGKVKADYIQDQINNLHKDNPWGSKDNHPGILGKLGHIASRVGNIAGDVLAPGMMLAIPGTDLNKGLEEHIQQGQEQHDVDAVNDKIKAEKLAATKEGTPEQQLIHANEAYRQAQASGDPAKIAAAKGVVDDITAAINAKVGNQGSQDHQKFSQLLQKIGTQDVADPYQQRAAIEAAHKAGVISDDENKFALGYLGSTGNAPATQAAVADTKRTRGKTLYFNTPTGRKAFTAEEAKANGLDPNEGISENEGQVSKDREKNSTYRVIQKSLEQYRDHIGKGDLQPKDITTLTAMTEDAESPDWASKFLSGVFDDLLGHPITGYSEKLMKGTLTKNQYQDLSPAARQVLADYYSTMMAHFANMKATQGTIPRNPAIIQTEMHTIPKPFLNGEEAKSAFQNYLDQVAMRNSENVDFGGATGTHKASAAPAEQASNVTHEVVKDGKVIGHVVEVDGKKKFQPLPLEQ